jgi:hypothetical protein
MNIDILITCCLNRIYRNRQFYKDVCGIVYTIYKYVLI